jgi:hypothetical protein
VLVPLYVAATVYCGIDEGNNNIPDGLILLVGNYVLTGELGEITLKWNETCIIASVSSNGV